MTSNIEMQHPTAPMLDHEEAIQHFECERGHCKEVEGDDHLTMVGEKGEPALARIATTLQASQISRDRALGDRNSGREFPSRLFAISSLLALTRGSANSASSCSQPSVNANGNGPGSLVR
jgi:hypothetical protein